MLLRNAYRKEIELPIVGPDDVLEPVCLHFTIADGWTVLRAIGGGGLEAFGPKPGEKITEYEAVHDGIIVETGPIERPANWRTGHVGVVGDCVVWDEHGLHVNLSNLARRGAASDPL